MRKEGGYLIATERDGKETIRDTITCCHCNMFHPLPPNKQPSMCKMCDKPICDKLKCYERCAPFEKQLEAMERSDRFRRSVG